MRRVSRPGATVVGRKRMIDIFKCLIRGEDGQDLIEYALLAALLAIACIVAMQNTATAINNLFGNAVTVLGS